MGLMLGYQANQAAAKFSRDLKIPYNVRYWKPKGSLMNRNTDIDLVLVDYINYAIAQGWISVGSGGVTNGDKGDVVVSGGGTTWTIDNNVVSFEKQADIATATIIGRVTAGTGDPEALTGTQATTLLNVFTSALKGLAPASGGGTTNFLRADGTWAAPSGGVTVSNDALTQGTVTANTYRLGGTATTISTPAAGEYTLTVQSGAHLMSARIFGNNTTLNGSNEMLIRVNNSANSLDRTFVVQLYDANNNALVDQQVTATVHTQSVSGNVTLITIPGLNGFGATGFYVEIR